MKLDSVPPETVTSEATKLVDASLRVKVNVAVLPTAKLVLLLETEMVGGVVSTNVFTAMVTVLLASEPSTLALPAASVNTPLAILTTPLVVLFAVGVNVAV